MELNGRIKKYMNERHFTQKELAKRAGITEASMSKYLNGERTPRIDVIVNLANALQISTDELLGNDIDVESMTFFKIKTVLARGMESMSEEDKKKLLKFLLENY